MQVIAVSYGPKGSPKEHSFTMGVEIREDIGPKVPTKALK